MKANVTLAAIALALEAALPALATAQPVAGAPAVGAGTELPAVVALGSRVANPHSGGSLSMPVTELRYDPRVDVQARNLAEGQADVSLRGGVFENTGFRIGAATIYDPQTGHYFAELPVSPAMLTPPVALFGAANAEKGFNATAGSVAYDWREIKSGGWIRALLGQNAFESQALFQGWSVAATDSLRIAADIDLARSTSDGSLPGGDHEFSRLSGRVQIHGPAGRTNFFAGYQEKFFGWPNLYTPFGFNETENLQTRLFVVDHVARFAAKGVIHVSAYDRRNKDDYEFNRSVPGASNPFQHTTRVRGVALEASNAAEWGSWNLRAEHLADSLDSTSLVFGPYRERTMTKLVAVGQIDDLRNGAGSARVSFRAGGTVDGSDEGSTRFSPIAEFAAQPRQAAGKTWRRVYLQYSGASQLPTYTALKSNPAAGLFRGNQGLGRETVRNLEVGGEFAVGDWRIESAAFARRSDGLTDWTFRRGVTARTANSVDIDVFGAEVVASVQWPDWDVVLGYTWLSKSADYRGALVDASFYALNYPRHRLTAALVWRPAKTLEIRCDNELRLQADNLLRRTGGDEAAITTLGAQWAPAKLRKVAVLLLVENLWDTKFEEVPAVPAGRRQVSGGVVIRW